MDLFKNLGNLSQIMGLASQLPKIQEEMGKLQQRIAQLTAEGDAGAGMVRVRVNGKQEILSCTLSEEVFPSGDREMLEELIRGAVNQAMERVRALVADETQKTMSSLGLPVGIGMPGMIPGA
jgi:DNA-binding YbaB/EbfC family protein